MAVTSIVNHWDYDGDDSTTVFAYGQPIQSEEDLQIIKTDADGTQTTLVLDTDYSVAGSGSEESSDWLVTYPIASGVDPLPIGASLTVNLNTQLTTNTDIETITTATGPILQKAFDKCAMQDITQQRQIDALGQLDVSEAVTSCTNAAAAAAISKTGAETAQEGAEAAQEGAETAQAAAEAAAASISLPTPTTGDEGKVLQVNGTHNGWVLGGTLAAKAGLTQSFEENINIGYVTNGTIKIMCKADAKVITSVSAICDSGTCTLTPQIDALTLGGGANSVSSTISTVTHSSANTVSADSVVTLVISANSSCQGLAVSIKGTRTLMA